MDHQSRESANTSNCPSYLSPTQGQGPLQRVHESDYYATEYYFWPEDDRWEQTEPVYVSGTCTESYWGVDHPKNKGKLHHESTSVFALITAIHRESYTAR